MKFNFLGSRRLIFSFETFFCYMFVGLAGFRGQSWDGEMSIKIVLIPTNEKNILMGTIINIMTIKVYNNKAIRY